MAGLGRQLQSRNGDGPPLPGPGSGAAAGRAPWWDLSGNPPLAVALGALWLVLAVRSWPDAGDGRRVVLALVPTALTAAYLVALVRVLRRRHRAGARPRR